MLKRLDFNMNIMDIQEYNESLLIAKCNIFHAGHNRNGSNITDNCAENMTKKIAYIPVVGEWKEQINDFGGHGGKIEISDEGINFVDTTTVFGCVLNEPVFKETYDGKEYYCCKVALYKEKFPQLESFINERKGQSMEISVKNGNFNEQEGIYYIEEANMTALCILGNEVEPCFAPSRISTFSLDEFEKQYQEVLSEVKKAFTLDGKEESMPTEDLKDEKFSTEEPVENEDFKKEDEEEKETPQEDPKEEKDPKEEDEEDYAKEEDEEGEEEKDPKKEEDEEEDYVKEEDEDKKKCTLTDEEVFALIEKCSTLETENAELKKFKLDIERAERVAKVDEMFAKFDLTEEEVKPLKKQAYEAEITLEVAEGRLYELMGRKLLAGNAQFTHNGTEGQAVVATVATEEETEISLPYGSLNKYFNKN